MHIYDEIQELFYGEEEEVNPSNVGLYEKRAGWGSIFLHNIYKSDIITKADFSKYNKPFLGTPLF